MWTDNMSIDFKRPVSIKYHRELNYSPKSSHFLTVVPLAFAIHLNVLNWHCATVVSNNILFSRNYIYTQQICFEGNVMQTT